MMRQKIEKTADEKMWNRISQIPVVVLVLLSGIDIVRFAILGDRTAFITFSMIAVAFMLVAYMAWKSRMPFLYLLIVFAGIFGLSILEPQASVMALVFECTSALSTVGSSLDLTPTLGSDSKLIVIVLMFIGRVGVLTLISSLIKQKKITKYKYPSDNIIIN